MKHFYKCFKKYAPFIDKFKIFLVRAVLADMKLFFDLILYKKFDEALKALRIKNEQAIKMGKKVEDWESPLKKYDHLYLLLEDEPAKNLFCHIIESEIALRIENKKKGSVDDDEYLLDQFVHFSLKNTLKNLFDAIKSPLIKAEAKEYARNIILRGLVDSKDNVDGEESLLPNLERLLKKDQMDLLSLLP